jgi:hypothetical protein
VSNWDIYVRESYDIVRRAESELTVTLAHEVEAYIVHLFAHFLDKPLVNTQPIGIKLLESTHKPITQRKALLKEIGDECLLINSMEWGKNRWPSSSYYSDIGVTAYMNRAYVERPPEAIYDELAYDFELATKILRRCAGY